MELNWFEIKNLKSIKDSGRCFLNNNINIFAGKNESGKSSILQALREFDLGKFSVDNYRLTEEEMFNPEVKVSFTCSSTEIKKIFAFFSNQDLGFSIEKDNSTFEFIVTKSPTKVIIEGSAIKALDRLVAEEIIELKDEISIALGLDRDNRYKLRRLDNKYSSILPFIESINSKFYSEEIEQHVMQLITRISSLDKRIGYEDIEMYFPRFILFNTFEDILPSEVNFENINESATVQRLFRLLSIKPNEIISSNSSHQKKWLLRNAATKINGEFGNLYTQNEVSLNIDIDGNKLVFSVKDDLSADAKNSPLSMEQRSQGFQWFLSFYITLEAEKLNDNAVILIDEPGLYLHATAQKDMLTILEKISEKHKILFSTHSPYLLNPTKLGRIHLVLKDKDTSLTSIESKIQKVADKETLTPIITAIGYDISQGIGYDKKYNIICEGISDYYYLSAFYKMVNKTQEIINLIPAVGVNQIPNISSILFGWGLNFVALVDNDAQGQGVEKNYWQIFILTKIKLYL